MLVLVVILVVYIVVRDLLWWIHPPPRGAPEGVLAVPQDINHAGRGASRVQISDDVQPPQVAVLAKQEKATSVDTAGPSTSGHGPTGERSRALTSSASQLTITASNVDASAATCAPTASLSSLGPSFVKKFVDLKVNPSHPRLTSPTKASHAGLTTRSAARGRTRSLSPLSTPPRSPTPSPTPTPSRTPVGSRGRPLGGQSAVDFSLYKKKTRALTKSPQKPQTKASGKSRADPVADVTTITTWFYKLSSNVELLAIPPDLIGHPEGLFLGDVYFDRAGDAYRLWLWSLDKVGLPHWKKIPFGYQRDDGKHLIVTRKNHLLSWVTPSYYKQIGSSDSSSVGEGEE